MGRYIGTQVFSGIEAVRAKLVCPDVRLYEQVAPDSDKYRPLTDLDKAIAMALYDEALVKGFMPVYEDDRESPPVKP